MSAAVLVHPFVGRDVAWLVRTWAQRRPGARALVWRDHADHRAVWTYRELADEVEAVAAGLADLGVSTGVRVGIHCGNRPEFVFVWLAALRLGAVVVTTNTRLTADELGAQLRRTSPRVVLTDRSLLGLVESALGDGSDVVVLVADLVEDATDPDRDVRPQRGLSTVRRPGAELPIEVVDPLAPAGIQFTSGTTSRPKGVVWSQANFLWAGRVSAAHEGLLPDEIHLTYLPLFHTNAQSYSVMATLWVGGTVLLVPRFSASRFWSVAAEERATWASMIPFAIRALLKQPVPEHSFRGWGTGVMARTWEERFRVPITGWWGMTETISHPIVSEHGLPIRSRTMGRAALEYAVRLRGDGGTLLDGPGTGSLEILGTRGVSMAIGYLDDPAADDAAWTDDGWMRTGDRVTVDEDGWFTFVEREGDMLRVGAENVAASEIEAVIAGVDGVSEVAVVAGPHPMLDEVPVAFVLASSPELDATELAAAVVQRCNERLADFKRPRAVYVEAELPRVTLEKVAKGALRDLARQRHYDYNHAYGSD